MKKRIFVLYTGGTIGMQQSGQGLQPDTALAGSALQPYADQLDFDWHIMQPLIDSSALTVQNWRDWLVILAEKIPQYDGILVLHGTDTMAYTANLFALALQGLDKPVVLTGSQLPFNAPDSDAPHNLAAAVALLECDDTPQVSIVFNGKQYPAVGSSKVSTETAAGFDNPHFGALAEWTATDGWKRVAEARLPDAVVPKLRLLDTAAKVVCHTLIPGFAATALAESLDTGRAGAVIVQSYGHGNAPDDAGFIEAVRRYTGRGGLLLNISQAAQGCVAAVYAQGSALRAAGAVSGGKCNLETATALLTLALSEGWTASQLADELQRLRLTETAPA